MAFEIKLRVEAVIEIEEALDYYLQIGPQIAFLFDEDIDNSLTTLKRTPFFEKKLINYRVLPLSKFPFIIIYTVIEEKKIIDIISIFYTFQNPDKYPTKK